MLWLNFVLNFDYFKSCNVLITVCLRLGLDSDHLSGPYPDEIKEGQWLGVSVRSQGPGKKAVVCAHR